MSAPHGSNTWPQVVHLSGVSTSPKSRTRLMLQGNPASKSNLTYHINNAAFLRLYNSCKDVQQITHIETITTPSQFPQVLVNIQVDETSHCQSHQFLHHHTQLATEPYWHQMPTRLRIFTWCTLSPDDTSRCQHRNDVAASSLIGNPPNPVLGSHANFGQSFTASRPEECEPFTAQVSTEMTVGSGLSRLFLHIVQFRVLVRYLLPSGMAGRCLGKRTRSKAGLPHYRLRGSCETSMKAPFYLSCTEAAVA